MTSSLPRVCCGASRGSYFRVGSGFWRSLACVAAFWLVAGAAFADAKPPLVTLVAGANQALLPKSDELFEVRVPIAVAADKPIVVRKVDVVYKEGRSDSLFGAFTVTAKLADRSNGAALVVSAKETLWPGTYVLSVAVAAGDKPKEEQSVVLNLTVPAPQVTASAKVVVTQLRYLGGSSASPGTLEVRETSGKVAALRITPMAMSDVPAHGEAVAAGLKFEPAASDAAHLLAPAKFNVLPDGDFPLGTTTGHIDVVSPSFATPLSVPFEVRAHRSELLILLVAAAGTFFGWLLRVFLTQRQTFLNAKGAIAVATRALFRAKRTCTDRGFDKEVTALFEQLADADETGDPKQMTDEAKAVEEAVKKLREGIEKKVPDLTTRLQNLNKIADVEWALPPLLYGAVISLRDPIRRATDLLNQRNVTDAGLLIDGQVDDAVPALARGLVEFVELVSKYVKEAADAPFPAAPLDSQRLTDLAAVATTAASDIKSTVRTGSLEETAIALTKTHELFLEVQALADVAVSMAEWLCNQSSVRLKRAFGDIDPAFAPVREQSVAAAQRFAQGILTPRTAVFGLRTNAVAEAWVEMLQKLSPTVAPDKLREAISKAQWLAAIDLAVGAAPKPVAAPVDDALKAMLVPAEGVDLQFSDESGGNVQMASHARSLGNEVIVDPTKEIAAQSDARRAFIAQSRATAALQSLCFGAIFIVGAYVVYGDNWVGTGKEMLAVFALAFGMDLTSDSVLAALKKSTT